jgi:hypothetical protein
MGQDEYKKQDFKKNWELQQSCLTIKEICKDVSWIKISYKRTLLDAPSMDAPSMDESFIEQVYYPENKVFFFLECNNLTCVHGGINLSDKIHSMLQNKITQDGEKCVLCNGRLKAGSESTCFSKFEYTIEIKYKQIK